MNQDIKIKEHHPDWKGYDIDELRYQLAYTRARIEIEKERMAVTGRSIYAGGLNAKASGIVGKILGSLNYVDYAIIAFKLIRRVYTIFHRRR